MRKKTALLTLLCASLVLAPCAQGAPAAGASAASVQASTPFEPARVSVSLSASASAASPLPAEEPALRAAGSGAAASPAAPEGSSASGETFAGAAASEASGAVASPEATESSVSGSAPLVAHEPELVSDRGEMLRLAAEILGVIVIVVLALLLFVRFRKSRRMNGVRNAQDEFWNPVKVVPFHKDSKPLPAGSDAEADPGLEAVSRTVDAVMAAEAEVKAGGQSSFEAAAAEAAKRMAEEKERAERGEAEEAEAQAPGRKVLDPQKALAELLEVKLALAENFISQGLLKQATELAQDVKKEKGPALGLEDLKARAAAVLERIGSVK